MQADKRRLVRVIANLLDNAAKYGGGATSVSLRQADDGVQIAVEDGGEGVPEEDRDADLRPLRPGRRRPAAGAAATASASAWPSSPSTSACTAGGCGSRTAPTAADGARFVVELPVEEHE